MSAEAHDRFYVFAEYYWPDEERGGEELVTTAPTREAAVKAAEHEVAQALKGESSYVAVHIENMDMPRDDGENIIWCWSKGWEIDPTGESAHA